MSNSKVLTTKEVARLCSVSDATVKRWEDANILNSERTSGGHRRFRAEEVARFQREQGLGLKNCPGDESVVTAALRRRENKNHSDSELFHSLVAGREEEVANILIGTYLNNKDLDDIFDDLICPAMCRIGELWMEGEVSIGQEHLATRAALSGLSKLRSVLPVAEPNGKIAMCCALEGEFHELPIHLAQIVFEQAGWEVINFGANMPIYALSEEVCQHSPQMVCISSTCMTDIERLSRDYKMFCEKLLKQEISIVVGGPSFKDETIRKRFPADLYANNFGQISEFISKLN